MASASSSRGGATGRMRNAASTLASGNQSLMGEIQKAFIVMKAIALDLERENETAKVRELENTVAGMLETLEDLTNQTSAIESVANGYRPAEELTNFKELLEAESVRLKAAASADSLKNKLMSQFREAVWNVHHAGQPMPGQEQEDVVMTNTQSSVLNITCPVSGKPLTQLAEPVRCVDCKHIYEKKAILLHIAKNPQCPITGCPKIVRADKLVCDTLLQIEIEEMRSMGKDAAYTNVVEDFTELDSEDDEDL